MTKEKFEKTQKAIGKMGWDMSVLEGKMHCLIRELKGCVVEWNPYRDDEVVRGKVLGPIEEPLRYAETRTVIVLGENSELFVAFVEQLRFVEEKK